MLRLKRISNPNIGEQGNVLVFSMLFMAAVALAFFQIFDTGRISLEKTRLQNIADSAAYSAAVLQARELNFHSYMNRAMVVNQAAIGQMVAISSYMQNAQQGTWDVSTVLEPVPYIGQAIKAIKDVLGGVNMATQGLATLHTSLLDFLIGLFSNASLAWHVSTTVQLADSIPKLVHDNDVDASINLASALYMTSDLIQYNRFTKRWAVDDTELPTALTVDGQAARRQFDGFRSLVLDSRDDFVRSRSKTFADLKAFKIVQKGGTEFGSIPGKTNPYYSWSAVDSMSVYTREKYFIFGDWEESVPIGWGRQATYHEGARFNWDDAEKDDWDKAPRKNKLAWKMNRRRDLAPTEFFEGKRGTPGHIAHFKVGGKHNSGFGRLPGSGVEGLRDFYQLRELTEDEAETGISGSPMFRVVVQKPLNRINDSARDNLIVRQDGPLALRESGAETAVLDRLHASSAARAVYERSGDLWRRGDSRYELANLYNPFWYPRLAEFEGRKGLNAALIGLDLL